jgi:hypothetical protein
MHQRLARHIGVQQRSTYSHLGHAQPKGHEVWAVVHDERNGVFLLEVHFAVVRPVPNSSRGCSSEGEGKGKY